ncbi:MAG: hypothetical protein K1X67_21460 [Fimbriimonadaceae bacterium]|nr:hypothetical protein [Fimbriimonadaceae bacterium]
MVRASAKRGSKAASGPQVLSAPPYPSLRAASCRLLNGDADEDNEVGMGDYAVLSGSYGTSRGDTGFVASAFLSGIYARAGDP